MDPQTADWIVKEHEFEGQHIRQYYDTVSHNQNYPFHLHAKQYIPTWNLDPQPGDMTFVALHANGMRKELYEPLWQDFLLQAKASGLRVRSIWMADVALQGESGLLNAAESSTEVNWFDHSRDILAMINAFRHEMPRPLVGVGHSMGATQLVGLASMHPRLFEGVALLECFLLKKEAMDPRFIRLNHQIPFTRRDLWDTREAAQEDMRKHYTLKGRDKRAFEIYQGMAIVPTPTVLYPLEGKWTLRTTKYNEFKYGSRPNIHNRMGAFEPDPSPLAQDYSDINMNVERTAPFYNAAPSLAFKRIKELRPKVLLIRGKGSPFLSQDIFEQAIKRTGTGVGGSGGQRLGHVEALEMEGNHLLTMTNPKNVAATLCGWATKVARHVAREDAAWEARSEGRSLVERHGASEAVRKVAMGWDGVPYPKPPMPKL